MRLDYQALVFIGALSASIHWLIARSHAMQWLWSRATGRLDRLLRCPACSGFWIGLGLGTLGLRPLSHTWITVSILASGLLSVIATPVFEAVFLWGLERSATHDPSPGSPPDAAS